VAFKKQSVTSMGGLNIDGLKLFDDSRLLSDRKGQHIGII
jgi:hypothetical protein